MEVKGEGYKAVDALVAIGVILVVGVLVVGVMDGYFSTVVQ